MYAAIEALACHMPKMKFKMRSEFLDHANVQLHAVKFLDDSFRTVRKNQVNKMITAAVLGAALRGASSPARAQSSSRPDFSIFFNVSPSVINRRDGANLLLS